MSRYLYIVLLLLLMLGLAETSLAQAVTIPPGTVIDLGIISSMLNNIATFLIFAGTVMAVIFLIWSGIQYVMAGADSQKITAAKQMLKAGLIGSLIIFGVGTIIRTIEVIGSGKIFGP